jgi:hypothetical protein
LYLLGYNAASSFACCLLHAGYFLGLLFNLEDRREMFLRNIGSILTDYTSLYSRRYNTPIMLVVTGRVTVNEYLAGDMTEIVFSLQLILLQQEVVFDIY